MRSVPRRLARAGAGKAAEQTRWNLAPRRAVGLLRPAMEPGRLRAERRPALRRGLALDAQGALLNE